MNFYYLAFVVKNEGKECVVRRAIGQDERIPRRLIAPIAPSPLGAREYLADRQGDVSFAVQCHSLGWTALAQELLRGGRRLDEAACLFRLREHGFSYWKAQIDAPGSDWRVVSRRLKRLMTAEKRFDTADNRELVGDLDAATAVRDVAPGSIEAMIDDLIKEVALVEEVSPPIILPVPFSQDTPCQRLARLGFKAVPALIDALEDRRITRVLTPAWNCTSLKRLRIQDLASLLLEAISGNREGGLRSEDGPLTRAAAMKWWLKAKPIGEEAYAAARAFPKEGEETDQHQLAVLAERYPRHLPAAYRALLKDPRELYGSWAFADAIAASRLERKVKVELLRAGARHKNLEYRFHALRHLVSLDAATARQGLASTFLTLPKKVSDNPFRRPEIPFASLVAALDDDLVWKAFEQAVRRANGAMRMELLHALVENKKVSPRQRRRILTFLAAFLGDTIARPNKRQLNLDAGAFDGAWSVQNLAALEMADLLDVEVPDDLKQNEQQWAILRTAVREAWDRERKAARHADPK